MRALGAADLQKEALQVCSLVIQAFSVLVHFFKYGGSIHVFLS